MTDLTMSQFASKDDLIAAQAARIAELEAEVDAERHHHGIRNASAVRTLHALGYLWRGTDAWQPPAEQGKCLHQIAEPQPEALRLAAWLLHRGMSGIKQNDIEASNQLRWLHAESLQHQQELAAYRFTVENRDARIAELEAELEAVGAGGVQRLAIAPQPCSRSHPHEEMTPMCELRTEIARLTNALARAEAQLAAAPQAVPGVGALDALQEAEAALELAIHRILKRDPGHAVHVTSEAKALVAVRAALDTAAPAHPAEGVANEDEAFEKWWSTPHVWGLGHKAAQRSAFAAGVAHAAATQPAAQGLDADGMYYLQDARHHAMVGNCPSFWREGGGYTTNLDEAEHFTLEAAMKQHKCRETDLPWRCSEVDKLRRPTVDCQYMPRSWDAQRAALAAQAKQGEQENG